MHSLDIERDNIAAIAHVQFVYVVWWQAGTHGEGFSGTTFPATMVFQNGPLLHLIADTLIFLIYVKENEKWVS